MSTQSPTANGAGQGPEPPVEREGADKKPWSPTQQEQGKENPTGDQNLVDQDEGEDPSKD